MQKFEVGKTYATPSICDHECVFSFTVIARTAKTVTLAKVHGQSNARRGLSLYNGEEQFKPFGSYSMCCIIGASDLVPVP